MSLSHRAFRKALRRAVVARDFLVERKKLTDERTAIDCIYALLVFYGVVIRSILSRVIFGRQDVLGRLISIESFLENRSRQP